MKRLLLQSALGSTLLLFGLSVQAQTPAQQIYNPYYSQDQYQNTHSMFDKLQYDVDSAQTDGYPNYLGDGARFDLVRTELRQLESNWDSGHYDSRQMENAIAAFQMVLNDNRLMLHDRNVLSADLSRLLEFRTEYY